MQQETQWTPERVELIKRTICPKGISDDEFALFVEQCKRSGLDPLLKEAFCVPRRVNIGTRDQEKWVTKHEFQPSEAGMLVRAERMPDYRGIQASAVYTGDAISVDMGKGEVLHTFNPAKREGGLVGAWSRVVRDGKVPVVVWLDFAAYHQKSPLWAKMPATMMEKCARAAGLRKTYPSQFGGLYVAGERPDDVETGEDVETPTAPIERPALPPPAPRETLESRVGERECVTVDARPVESAPQQAREPGSDDGGDDIENESLAIVHACEKVADMDAYRPLATRGVALGKAAPGSDAAKRAATALRRAHARLTSPPASSAQKESVA